MQFSFKTLSIGGIFQFILLKYHILVDEPQNLFSTLISLWTAQLNICFPIQQLLLEIPSNYMQKMTLNMCLLLQISLFFI